MAKDIFSKETWLLGLKLVLAQRVVTFPLEQRGFSCVDPEGLWPGAGWVPTSAHQVP